MLDRAATVLLGHEHFESRRERRGIAHLVENEAREARDLQVALQRGGVEALPSGRAQDFLEIRLPVPRRTYLRGVADDDHARTSAGLSRMVNGLNTLSRSDASAVPLYRRDA